MMLLAHALLEDGPHKGRTVEIETLEGRAPMTVDLPVGNGGVSRYRLGDLTQEGITASDPFLYAA